MDTMSLLMEMPLLGVLHFQESALPMLPEELVDALLAQLNQK